ncbi:hypothetical protein BpHYR1_018873 [Brachionus plicatilis]|uniref:Uncharacterized protein n=1 Tax=Brachionus plicatilis TaxID=10195 RepID=A0A3M7QH49_BRAPC|nr:hypothetical protein BpHYR1_018873 [Brachionus plicatilis]
MLLKDRFRICIFNSVTRCFNNNTKARAERITTIYQETNEQIEIDNVNIKKFHKEPVIENKELLDAYDWNKLEKKIQHVGEYYMVKSGNETNLSREECKQFLQRLETTPWNYFDVMIEDIKSIYLIKFNNDN